MKKFQNTDHTVLLLILNEKALNILNKQISKLCLQQKPIFLRQLCDQLPLTEGKTLQ